jgi:hypothetical protein
VLAALLGVGLATQRIPSYFPSEATIIYAIRLAAAAVKSRAIIGWRQGGVVSVPAVSHRTMYACTTAGAGALADAARLLTVLKSFSGDLKMIDRVAMLVCNVVYADVGSFRSRYDWKRTHSAIEACVLPPVVPLGWLLVLFGC